MNASTVVRSLVLGCVFLVATVAVLAQPPQSAKPSRSCTTRVLFLGNSYTYFNNVPAILSALAQAGHQCSVETRMVAPGGKTLKDHWESSASREALNSQAWDFVVLQDGSASKVGHRSGVRSVPPRGSGWVKPSAFKSLAELQCR